VLVDQGMPDPEPTLAELRWRSRRGTRELDLILLSFLSASYENLTPQDRRAYARLLDASDPDLTIWLFGQTTPDDPEIARLVRAIRAQSFSPKGSLRVCHLRGWCLNGSYVPFQSSSRLSAIPSIVSEVIRPRSARFERTY
jgi:antitoxin CptB